MHPTDQGREAGRFSAVIDEGRRRYTLTEHSFAAAASRALEAVADAQAENRYAVGLVICGGVVWFRVDSDGHLWAAEPAEVVA